MSKEPVKREQSDDQRLELERRQRFDPLYLENTKPDDPSSRQGQITRDNVNPSIPSGKRGDPPNSGGIVDPKSLGMESQAGAAPPKALDPDKRDVGATPGGEIFGSHYSINEPLGSDVVPEDVVEPQGRGAVKTSKVHSGANADPDDIEDELDQMREEGDVEMRGKTPPKKK